MSEKNLTLRQVCDTLELSNVWVRRQLSKKIGELGEHATKIDKIWMVPVEVVERERIRLEAKREKYRARKSGELPKYYNVYTPDRVKAPLVVIKMLSEYATEDDDIEAITQLMMKMNKSENDKWSKRIEKKKKKNS